MRLPVLVVLLLCAAAPAVSRPAPADMVFRGGRVYGVSGWAEGLAVREGRIVALGGSWEDHVGATTRVVDLGGRLMIPAFHDSHVHPVDSVLELRRGDLTGARTVEEILEVVRREAASSSGWVQGTGWALPLFPASGPLRETLDAVVPDRPAILWAADGHSAWLNTEGLRQAGITAATPDPPGGRIERAADGTPSGTLRESAVELAEAGLPPTPAPDWRSAALEAQAMAHRLGIVGVQDANSPAEALRAYRTLDREGRLTLRVRACLSTDPSEGLEQVDRLVAERWRFTGGRVQAEAVKFFMDGVMESGTAAMEEPYEGTAERGILNWEPARLGEMVRILDSRGFQMHFHAIGDRAVRAALDTLEGLPPRDRRAVLAHVELVRPEDVGRFRALGALACFQPLWAYADPYIVDMTLPVVGPARGARLYPIGSLVRSGAHVAGGSDWSVSSMDPLEAMEVAVTRRAPDAPDGEAWLPDERIGLREALAAYTSEGAYAAYAEDLTGTLEVGKAADLVVLSRDIFAGPPSEISEARVLLTVVDGRPVYASPAFELPATR